MRLETRGPTKRSSKNEQSAQPAQWSGRRDGALFVHPAFAAQRHSPIAVVGRLMQLTEEQALAAAWDFLARVGRTLPYPVIHTPIECRRREGSQPPRLVTDSATIGSQFWEFDFMYDTPGKLVDPSGVRIFVDAFTGAAALFSPR